MRTRLEILHEDAELLRSQISTVSDNKEHQEFLQIG
jgi:hypothetical protein